MWSVLMTAIIGLVLGALGAAIMPAKDPGGRPATTALGICGAMVGTFFGVMMGWYEAGSMPGFIMAVVGAVI
ncbi:MAG: GlsB/YeaQ/YmgE family stress response membrane protein, partial [Acidobacteria bacterium]|nr:GlsB/YeaQ/YmgE family stress response membrane protein [Acidobacteriota bacterium]